MTEENKEPSTSAADSGEEPASATTSDADLQKELDEARAKAAEYYQSWQRTAADFANFKRRMDEEKKFAERWIIQDLLPVLDDFERAWAAAPTDMLKFTWVEGVVQIYSKMFSVLQRHGISPIEATGQGFNPLEHDAVMHEDDSDLSEQTAVVGELQRGYRLHERVLRPALVKVGRPRQDGNADQAVQPESAS